MTIRIGTSEPDGTFHSQGRALKAILERQAPLGPLEVLESKSASVDNAKRLQAGEIERGFMASNSCGPATRGETPFVAPGESEMVMRAVPDYRSTVIRRQAIRGLEQDVAQIAVVNVLATHARVSESVVCDVVGAVIREAGELGRINPLFVGLQDLFAPLRLQGP